MKLFYATTKSFTGRTADHIYISELAKALSENEEVDFTIITNGSQGLPENVNALEIKPLTKIRTINFFIDILFNKKILNESVDWFISNDFNLLISLILIRYITGQKYKICFDAHLLTETWKDSFVLKNVDVIITTSDKLNSIIKSKCINCVVHTIYGGVNKDAYSPEEEVSAQKERMRLNIKNEAVVIGYVGGFTTMGMDKGLSSLIEVIGILPSNYILLLVGGKPEEVLRHKALSNDLGVSEKCIILGKVETKEVPRYQMMSDVLTIPYPDQPHFNRYGFPMKVFEYLATNRPVVYSKLPMLNSLLSKFENCYEFVPENVISLSKAILTTEKSPEAGFNISLYTWKTKSKSIIKVLKEIS
jgi:glycosyltransferase involved in cell wall biosynthesis